MPLRPAGDKLFLAMAKFPFYQIDAFADRPFTGNPAAVCLLESWPDDGLLQQIAAENNLAETAFTVPLAEGFEIRWFTPTVEVDLCGHATLAAARALREAQRVSDGLIRFETLAAGPLTVRAEAEMLWLNFPSRPPRPVEPPTGLAEALGVTPRGTHRARDLIVELASENEVRDLQPDTARLRALDEFAVCVTARGSRHDFVSRFFAPRQGIDEDPVTGSSFCSLAPFWFERLGRHELTARQLSLRGGEITCRVQGDRVEIGGRTNLVITGTFYMPDEP